MPRGHPQLILHRKAHVDGIKSVAAACGLTPSVLRIWEHRYGWPVPQRHLRNNYRCYDARTIFLLKCVSALVKSGKPIGLILKNPSFNGSPLVGWEPSV